MGSTTSRPWDQEEEAERRSLLTARGLAARAEGAKASYGGKDAFVDKEKGLKDEKKKKPIKDYHPDTLLAPTDDGRQPHLDVFRCLCLSIVVLDHGNPNYAVWNLYYGQSWALQFIWIICGVSFGLSKKSLGGYLIRLFAFLVVGICINWLAFVLTGRDWRHDFFNVVFQFWFLVALCVYSLWCVPVRLYCNWAGTWFQDAPASAEIEASSSEQQQQQQGSDSVPVIQTLIDGVAPAISVPWALRSHRSQQREGCAVLSLAMLRGVLTIVTGLVAIWIVFSYCLGVQLGHRCQDLMTGVVAMGGQGLHYWAGEDAENGRLLRSLFTALELSMSNIWLAVSIPLFLPGHQAWTGWVFMCNMYFRRLFPWYTGAGEKLFQGFDLMMLGIVCNSYGLRHRQKIGMLIARYWMVWVAVLGLIWIPGTSGRMDMLMNVALFYRWRMRLFDFWFTTLFLTAAERFADPKTFTVDKCQWMVFYGLFLYLVHKFIHLTLASPFNWYVILGIGPMFWCLWRVSRKDD